MARIIQQVMLNHLIYNPNRDPEVYRRPLGKPFHIKVLLGGKGKARVRLEAEGRSLCQGDVALPGAFECDVALETPGLHPALLTVETEGHRESRHLPLDVEA